MADARAEIFAALRARAVRPRTAAPEPEPVRTGDRLEAFAAALARAGGRARRIDADVASAAAALPGFAAATRVWSSVPGVPPRGVAPDEAPAALRDLDFALLPGRHGVAESGGVWWEPADRRERAAGFLAEHVVFVLPARAVLWDLQALYERGGLDGADFACCVAGPSKTADIEQSLVIGAHGPRALTVLLPGGEDGTPEEPLPAP